MSLKYWIDEWVEQTARVHKLTDENTDLRTNLDNALKVDAQRARDGTRLTIQVMELRAMLRRLEWTMQRDMGVYSGCELCKGNRDRQGHKPDCDLAALLEAE